MSFSVWAPERHRVRVRVDGVDHDMTADGGWWRADVSGTDYAFLLDDDDTPLPDPRSLWQPDGVHGASRVYDHAAFPWSDSGWTGRSLPGGVVYELHIGTFTPGGTFDSAVQRLDHLAEMGPAFVEVLPVGKFHGIGPATSAKMNSLGLYTGLDMRNQTLEFMQANFGKAGAYYYWISRGVDDREVRANRIRKSVGAENTFSSDLTEFEPMVAELQPLIDKVWRHCDEKGSRGRTVTLKVKFADFELISRSRTLAGVVGSRNEFEIVSAELLKALFPMQKAVRLLGVSISGFKLDEIRRAEQIALGL